MRTFVGVGIMVGIAVAITFGGAALIRNDMNLVRHIDDLCVQHYMQRVDNYRGRDFCVDAEGRMYFFR